MDHLIIPPPLPDISNAGNISSVINNMHNPILSSTPNTKSGCLGNIIKICEKHIFGQTASIQGILNVCSQVTGYPGYETICGQIISSCNQSLSDTYQCGHSIINLCQSISQLDLDTQKAKASLAKFTPAVKVSDSAPKIKIEAEPSTSEEFESPVSGTSKPKAKDDEMEFSNSFSDDSDTELSWKVEPPETDSDDDINQEDNPDWLAHWEKKKKSHLKGATEALNISSDAGQEDDPEWAGESASNAIRKKLFRKKKSHTKDAELDPNDKSSPKTKKKGEFQCSTCTKSFTTEKGYENHQAYHNAGNKIKCDTCGIVFPSPSHLKSHKRTHTGERPFICDVCGNSYAQMSTLKGHMLLHTDERPVSCELCDYTCKSRKRLKRHMIVHSSEKKFQCDNCGDRFARSCSLKKHLRIHKDEWPFLCDLCPKKFKCKVHLKRHEKVHTDEFQYQCKICGKRTRQAGNLKVHMRTHNGEKPYVCELCGKSFAHNVTRRQHKEHCFGKVLIDQPTDYSKYDPTLFMSSNMASSSTSSVMQHIKSSAL